MMEGEGGGQGRRRGEERQREAETEETERKCFDQTERGQAGKQTELHGNLLSTHLLLHTLATLDSSATMEQHIA